jgi:hypothetical protein
VWCLAIAASLSLTVLRCSVRGSVYASSPRFAPASDTLLDWDWVLALFASSRNAWLATVRPDGRPHAAPLWVVAVEGAIWFWTPDTTIKGTNLAHDNRAVLHVESGDDIAIIEGRASDREVTSNVVKAYAAKYSSTGLSPMGFWTIEVESALAWQGHLGDAQINATRFTPTP